MQKLLSYIRRAADDYNMIQDGDVIAVGLSGGKDSLSLLAAMNVLKNFYPKKFDVIAISLDLGYDTDYSEIKRFCQNHGIKLVIEKTKIKQIVFDERREKNPCSLCAKLRRGALYNTAVREGANKVALAHHKDDVIETVLMSILYESKIDCFAPVTYYDKQNIFVVRPLIYAPESYVSGFSARAALPVFKNPCPADKHTKRQEVKELIASLSKTDRDIKKRIFAAVKSSGIYGWQTKKGD